MTTSIGKDGIRDDAPGMVADITDDTLLEKSNRFILKRIEKVKEVLREREAKKLRTGLLSREDLARQIGIVRRAAETRRFLEGDFWQEYLKPLLADAEGIKPWKPGGAKTMEQVTVQYLLESGKAGRAQEILEEFTKWIRAGEEAKKIIAADTDRRAKADEAARA